MVTVLAAAGGCAGEDDHFAPVDENGWAGASQAGQAPGGGAQSDAGTGDGGATVDGGGVRCAALGGRCMSDTDDPTMPAFCEAMELVEIGRACADLHQSCCAPATDSQCEAGGGQCVASPAGEGTPADCADRGLVPVGAICPDIDQTCCA